MQQLADIGKVIDDSEVAEILLSGLPSEYDSLVSNLETVNMTTKLNSEVVRARLLQEEIRKTESSSESNTAFVSKVHSSKSPFKGRCHYCKKVGHTKAYCYKLKRDKRGNEEQAMVAALMVQQKDAWFVDSGCTTHMCNQRDLFVTFMDNKTKVTVANNETLQCEGMGDIYLQLNGNMRKLSNVLYIPELSTNLLSVSRLINNGFCVKFTKEGCTINDGLGVFVGFACLQNGMYRLKVTSGENMRNGMSCLLSHCQEVSSSAVATQHSNRRHI